MSYPEWPAYALAPPPLNESYKLTLPDTVIRTDFEQGLARQRRVFSNGPTGITLTWPMTSKEFKFFLAWKQWALAAGEGWFTLPVFYGDDYHVTVVRFVKGPLEPTRSGGEWMTTAQLETMDSIYPTMTETASMMLTWDTELSLETVCNDFHAVVAALSADCATLFPWLFS